MTMKATGKILTATTLALGSLPHGGLRTTENRLCSGI
jgi:hypothetical protein